MSGIEWVCGVGVGLSAIYAGISHWCLDRWCLGGEGGGGIGGWEGGAPITFLRPLKAGVPELGERLEVMVRASRVGDQIVFGVDAGSAEERLCDALRRTFPEREIVVVVCQADAAHNMKIAKLVQMTPHARHEHWLLADAEAVLDGDFLAGFRQEWQVAGVDALTAGYRIGAIRSWPQRLDAAAALLTLWPGLGILWAAGGRDGLRITLGACTGLRRRDLEEVGGWMAFGNELAEDNRLGDALAAGGRRIGLSRHVVELGADPMGWRDWWRHQRRVAVTYRVGNPLGFAGAIVTYGEFWSVLLIADGAVAGGLVSLCATWALRTLLAWRLSRRLDFPIPALPVVVFVASGAALICWWASWFSRAVWWGGKWRRVTFPGKLTGM